MRPIGPSVSSISYDDWRKNDSHATIGDGAAGKDDWVEYVAAVMVDA